MNKKETNRALQRGIAKEFTKGVKLLDVDTTIAEYMVDTVIPDVEEHGNKVKVPLLYGNAERWNNARAKGYLRDQRGKIQIPLVMFKRNSIERDTALQQFKDVNTLPAYKKYSKKNRYERFSLQPDASKAYEQYEVSVPDYVTVTYEVMIWTSFTEHMNTIVNNSNMQPIDIGVRKRDTNLELVLTHLITNKKWEKVRNELLEHHSQWWSMHTYYQKHMMISQLLKNHSLQRRLFGVLKLT